MSETCAATHTSPTANGDLEVRGAREPGHVAAGDPVHEAWVGVFPVRWTGPLPQVLDGGGDEGGEDGEGGTEEVPPVPDR